MNIKTRTWIISTVAIIAATAALAGFVAMVKPVHPTDSSPSLRQQVMAKKVAQIAKAPQLATQVNARSAPSREPVAADDTGIGTTLGIVGTCTVVLVVVSLGTLAAWDRLQTARR